MKQVLLSLFILFALVFVSSSYRNASVPNPGDYTKLFLETIRKNDRQLYLNTFGMNNTDIKWLYTQMNNNPFAKDEDKQDLSEKLLDTAEFIRKTNAKLSEGFDEFTNWVKVNKIDLNQLGYVAINYRLEYDPKKPFYICEDLDIYVKHEDKYFRIAIDEAVYLNGRWVYGEIQSISERDQYLDRIRDEYAGAYAVDSTVAYADTVAMTPSEYDVYSEGDYSAPVVNKKQQKIQKKIEALRKKEYELYEKLELSY